MSRSLSLSAILMSSVRRASSETPGPMPSSLLTKPALTFRGIIDLMPVILYGRLVLVVFFSCMRFWELEFVFLY